MSKLYVHLLTALASLTSSAVLTFVDSVTNEDWDDIRLVNGSTLYSGRVEVKVNGTWGTVCDDLWSWYDGYVACRQLGFDSVYYTKSGGRFGSGSGPILHSDLRCTSHELNLSDCPGTHDPDKINCTHAEDAGLSCQPPYHRPSVVAHLHCTERQFMCGTRRMCIPARWVCDGRRDCSDGSDEAEILCKTQSHCGIQKIAPTSVRVVGGTAAREGTWPWMVSLRVVIHSTMTETVLCGGTLVASRWVLTAAHCFEHFKASNSTFRVLLGDYSCHVTESSEQSIDVESVYIHSKYHHSTHANDIALIKLARDVDTSRGDVIPACLPIHGSKTFEPGDACFVTGWGETGGTGKAGTLQQAMVPIINTTQCNDWYNGSIKAGMLCAGYHYGGIDACKGDSGGPLSCKRDDRWYVAGIVSWGEGCARVQHPGIYTDVAHYITWIDDVTNTYDAINNELKEEAPSLIG